MPSGQRASNYLCAFFFLNDTATPEIYTLSLHDALPIWFNRQQRKRRSPAVWYTKLPPTGAGDRKSTRLNSSHPSISYAVFCLKKKTGTCKDCELWETVRSREACVSALECSLSSRCKQPHTKPDLSEHPHSRPVAFFF